MNLDRLLIRLSELLPDIEVSVQESRSPRLRGWLRRFFDVLQYASALNQTKCGTPDCPNNATRIHAFKSLNKYVYRVTLPLCDKCISLADEMHPINSTAFAPVQMTVVRFPIADKGINHAEFIIPVWLDEEGKQVDK